MESTTIEKNTSINEKVLAQKVASTKNLICKICGFQLVDVPTILDHFKTDHPDDTIQRDIAIFLIENPFHHSNPYTTNYPTLEKKFTCDICGQKISTEIRLRIHKNRKHDIDDADLFALENKLTENLPPNAIKEAIQDLSNKPSSEGVICTICGKSCLNIHGLNRHKARIHGIIANPDKSELCDLCGKRLKNWRGVKRHKWEIHPETRGQNSPVSHSDPRTCSYCGLLLKDIRGKNSHETTCDQNPHLDRDSYCEFCHNTFQNKHGLARHKSSCSENPKNKNQSEKPTTNPSTSPEEPLEKTNQPSNVCDICGQVFANWRPVGRHKSTKHHIKGRPTEASSGFSTKSKKDTRLSSYKTYCPNGCGSRFLTSKGVKDHQQQDNCTTDHPVPASQNTYSSLKAKSEQIKSKNTEKVDSGSSYFSIDPSNDRPELELAQSFEDQFHFSDEVSIRSTNSSLIIETSNYQNFNLIIGANKKLTIAIQLHSNKGGDHS